MDASDLRKRLFRVSKPSIRPFADADIAWLWAAYKHGSFASYELPEMDQAAFATFVREQILPRYHAVELIEDINPAFSAGKGPVALVTSFYDGWRLEPHVDWFSWATKRDVLRGTVAYLQRARWRKDVGVVTVRSLPNTKKLFDRAEKYGVVQFRTKIPFGDPRGHEFIYTSRGNHEEIILNERNWQRP